MTQSPTQNEGFWILLVRTPRTQVRAEQPFNAVGTHWDVTIPQEGTVSISIRVSWDATDWSAWIPVELDPDRRDKDCYGRLIMVPPSQFAQYKVSLEAPVEGQPPALRELELIFISSAAGPTDTTKRGAFQAAEAALSIIPRQGWGADEKLQFDDKGEEIWPPEYRTVEKVILHHTVTANNDPDPMKTMRAIYYYHAVTQGWGDIGYNFVIDASGNVYQGRQGGSNVVGGHALSYNYGSVGIAVLGNFASVMPQPAVQSSVVSLLASTANYLDPLGSGYFIDQDLPNIMGHCDCVATACPGQQLYEMLPALRQRVLKTIGYTPTPVAEITRVFFTPTIAVPGHPVEVQVTVTNTGTGLMSTQGPQPGLLYQDGENFVEERIPEAQWEIPCGCRLVREHRYEPSLPMGPPTTADAR